MWMASAVDFVMIFVSLELVTISFYILVAYMRRNSNSLEAGVKYLVLGALSTGFFVYGVTWIFGLTGTTNLAAVRRAAMRHFPAAQGPLLFGFILILIGLGFKIAAVPVPVLGARCLPGRADADHRLSFRRLESGRVSSS